MNCWNEGKDYTKNDQFLNGRERGQVYIYQSEWIWKQRRNSKPVARTLARCIWHTDFLLGTRLKRGMAINGRVRMSGNHDVPQTWRQNKIVNSGRYTVQAEKKLYWDPCFVLRVRLLLTHTQSPRIVSRRFWRDGSFLSLGLAPLSEIDCGIAGTSRWLPRA